MKSKSIIFFFIILVIIGVYTITHTEKSIVIENIEYLRFNYTTGFEQNDKVKYEMSCNKSSDKCKLIIKPNGISEDDKMEVEVDKAIKTGIEDKLRKYDVVEWNGFHRQNRDKLDGTSFSIEIHLENGKKINAQGYALFPTNYDDVKQYLDGVFMTIYNEDKNKE